MSPPAIGTEHLGKRFDVVRGAEPFWALKDVSFSVERGEILGIAGSNGAGKSTLLKILARVTAPSEGRVMVRGRVGSLLEVGTGFHPELSGRENVYLNASILGLKKSDIDSKFDEIVAFSGVEPFIDLPVKHYSSGMHVRLAFSVAANLDTDILLMDEVLAVGDAAFQKRCYERVQEILGAGKTVLFVSHNLGAMRELCPRTVVLERGRLVYDGSTDEALERYLSVALPRPVSSVDTTHLPRPTDPNSGIRIRRVRFHGMGDEPRITGNAAIGFTMSVEVTRPQSNVAFEFWVETSTGLRLLYGRSAHVGIVERTLEPGWFEVSGEIQDHRIAPGRYRLGVGARSGERGLDWVFNVLEFVIDDDVALSKTFEPYVNAHVRSRSRWSDLRRITPNP